MTMSSGRDVRIPFAVSLPIINSITLVFNELFNEFMIVGTWLGSCDWDTPLPGPQ